jgi:phosphonate degradation associated HDIG domain protein
MVNLIDLGVVMQETFLQTLMELFRERGSERYSDEAVTQLEHAIQCALLAKRSDASSALVCAALLHDVGHLLVGSPLPTSNEEDLDDGHESKGYAWLSKHFGPAVADPVRLHVPAKRYLCTVEPTYQSALSPTSYKSFLDQGGMMTETERQAFEAEPYFMESLQLRRWDDLAKDEHAAIPAVESFLPLIRECMTASPAG